MDPRLRRWGVIAGAGVLLAGFLLLPGGDPILSAPGEWDPWKGLSALQAEQKMVEDALYRTTQRITILKRRRAVQAKLSDRRDPLVVASSGNATPMVAKVQRIADSIWSTLPAHDAGTRTVLDISYRAGWYGGTEQDIDGNCIAGIGSEWGGGTPAHDVQQYVGGCLFREAFGPPGPSWEAWQKQRASLRLYWRAPETTPYRRYLADLEVDRPRAWFEFAEGAPLMMSYTGVLFRTPLQLAYAACLAGRLDQCSQAYQVDTGAVPGVEVADGPTIIPTWGLPATLLADLGPAKFAELWRTDLPISAEYARLAGRPIDPILADLSTSYSGPRLRETPLPLLSWMGLLFWVGLLVLWARERIKLRVAA